jgi:hypothetical protein
VTAPEVEPAKRWFRVRLYAAGEDGHTPPLAEQRLVWQDVRCAFLDGTGRFVEPTLCLDGAGPTGAYHGQPLARSVILDFQTTWPEAMYPIALAGGVALHGGFRATWEPVDGPDTPTPEVRDVAA